MTTLVNTSNKGPSSKKKGRSKKAHVLAVSVEQATQNFLEKGEQIAKDSQDLKEELIAAVEDVRKQGERVVCSHADPVLVLLKLLYSVMASVLVKKLHCHFVISLQVTPRGQPLIPSSLQHFSIKEQYLTKYTLLLSTAWCKIVLFLNFQEHRPS